MNILFFAIGSSLSIHQQAQFAIRTVYIHAGAEDNIFILTDSPVLYANIPFVRAEEITPQEIRQWKGEKDYFFRVKINAIRKFISHHREEDLMYMDTDVVFHGDMAYIKGLLERHIGLMHKDEFAMPEIDPRSGSGIMWQQTKGKVYGGIEITERHHMWNSGAVAIPKSVLSKVMDTAITICDEFLADGVTCFNMEQWAVSIALLESTSRIEPLDRHIWHYWHYKYVWGRYIADFFNDSYSHHNADINWELEQLRSLHFSSIHRKLQAKRTLLKIMGRKH